MSYVTIIVLIIVSYNAIVPEDEIPVFKNEKKLVKKVENNFKPNEDSIYDIIEQHHHHYCFPQEKTIAMAPDHLKFHILV